MLERLCIDGIIEIRRLSENIYRDLNLESGGRRTLRVIELRLASTILCKDYAYGEMKSITDGSRGSEDEWNALWSKYRKRFQRIIRRSRVYINIGCVHVRSMFQQ